MSNLPPLPAGFVLERPSTRGTPPLPPGFELETGEDRKFGGAAMNATAGANETLYSIAGAPVDIVRGAMNLAGRGINAVTGSSLPQIPEDSFGGSRSIAKMAGAIRPELDPANTEAKTTGERVARGTGAGVAGTILPAAAVGAAVRGGAQVSPLVQAVAGRSNSVRAVGADAVAGAAGGAAASAAMEATPDKYDPLSGMAGGIVGGGLGALVTGIPGLVRETARAGGDFLAPLTQGGRERMAGQQINDAATDPSALREALANRQAEIVPGSKPTTGQMSGDMGVLALERAAQSRSPEQFQQRRADQNTARRETMEGVQSGGAAENVTKALRDRLRQIETEADGDVRMTANTARARNEAVGQSMRPEDAGDVLRENLTRRRNLAVEKERRLWNAVDPDGSLALSAANTTRTARDTMENLPASAKPPSGEEAAIYDVLGRYGDVVPFGELTALRSRLSTAMADERGRHGKSPTWARMSELRGAIERDIDDAVTTKATSDADAVAAGQMRQEDTIVARLENLPSTGSTVYTASGRSVPIGYEVVDAASLQTSNLPDGRPNPAYPGELQPRDRNRAASDAQIATMSRNLQPERLGPSSEAGTGAPIVGPDGIVESGNGRVLAIRRAYAENGASAKAYRDYLNRQGYRTDGMQEPVLIRRRPDEMSREDRARFAQEGNANSTMSMSASEQASTDASRLTPQTLGLYRGGDVNSPENRDFARAFLGSVADRGQEGSFVTGGGTLSVDGANRMRNALLSSAYGDSRLVAALADEGDENIRAFGRALGDISGDVARLRAGITDGRVDASADVSPALTEAARIVQRARAGNVRIADVVAQADAFNPVSDEAIDVLRMAYGDTLNGRLSRDRLNEMMRWAIGEAEQQVAGARLFGEALDARTILAGVRTRYGSAAQAVETTGFSSATPDRAGNGALRAGEGRLGGLPNGAAQPVQGGSGSQGPRIGGSRGQGRGVDPRILEEPPLEPNFDRGARDRLNRATEATRQRADTFDGRQLGPMLARPADHASYNMESARVASRAFTPGAAGFERMQAVRRALGPNSRKGMAAIESYAIDSMRKAAMGDDGVLDAAKVDRWRRAHSDALRAFPELDIRIQDAASASETAAQFATARKAAVDDAQRGAIGRLIGVEDPQDVSRIVGGLFGRQDSVQQLGQLRRAIGNDQEALQGLRRATADFLSSRLMTNTEAATSGQTLISADQMQTFVRQNKAALRTVFSAEEVTTLEAVAADLQRANRSLTAVRIPGQSNTVQDALAVTSGDTATSILGKLMTASMASGGALAGLGVQGGGTGAVLGAGAGALVGALRQSGIQRVDELVTDALLNPNRARMLLAKVPANNAKRESDMMASLARRYARAAVASAAVADGSGDTQRPREMLQVDVPARRPASLQEVLAGP